MAPLPKQFVVPPVAKLRAPVDVALSYTGHGIPVFPCREGDQEAVDPATGEVVIWPEKSPYTSNGLNGATASHRITETLFGERHPFALIGVPTGEKLGAWVLDIDAHGERDGYVWLAEMEAKHGPLPETARSRTANGGTHIFFRHVVGIRNRAAIAPGVDTRGTGGYIIAPGSVMADGRAYEWIDWDGAGLPPFADTPSWLLAALRPAPVAPVTRPARQAAYEPVRVGDDPYVTKAVAYELEKAAGARQGERGHQLFASACALGEFVAAGALSRSEAEAGLMDAARACGVADKDGDRATMDRIRRGLDKTRSTPRDIPEPSMPSNDNTPLVSVEAMIRRAREKGAVGYLDEDDPAAREDPVAERPKRARFETTWFDEIEEGAPKETFIKGVFGCGEFTTVSGLPGTGKSVIVTDAACHVAMGREWHGRKVKQGLVVYVAAERKKLTERRMMAFRKRHGAKDVPLLVLGGRLDFTKDLKDARDLIAEIKRAEDATGEKCIWVIIDTLTRVFGAGDQNASKDMGRFVQACDEIASETSAHVTAIHHSAWSGERGKGAIDLDGAVDASFMVKKTGKSYQLICDGTNDGEEGAVVSFKMDSVELGKDEDGEVTTAPVVVATSGEEPAARAMEAHRGTPMIEAIKAAIEEAGEAVDDPDFPQDRPSVVDMVARKHFIDARVAGGKTAGSARMAYDRQRQGAIRDGLIGHRGQYFWLLD